MTAPLRSVGGSKDSRPLWDRPLIPIPRSEEGRDVTVSVKLTKSQKRHIDVTCAQNDRPEILTPSDYMYCAFQLMQEHVKHHTSDEDTKRYIQLIQTETETAARREAYGKAVKLLEDLKDELALCYDTFSNVTKPGRLREAFASLERIKDQVPTDLRSEAQDLWDEHHKAVQALKP